jgi:protein-L-isoaspartate(D-aspartate) O-methyltransferase
MSQHLNEPSDLYNFFRELDRSLFIDNEYKDLADRDRPLPIGHGQTISQPTLVYQMTNLLDLNRNSKVLEIGTGSGYQTALLAKFAAEVYTVERIAALSAKAQERLAQLGYVNVQFKIGDGSEGWSEFAPYDRIIVTAGAGKLPEPLVDQLKPEGKMLIPVGEKGAQDLLLIQKDKLGKIYQELIDKVVFVELKGSFGWD